MYEKKKKAFPTTKYYNFSHFSGPGDKIIYFNLFSVEELVSSLEHVVTWENSLLVFYCQF